MTTTLSLPPQLDLAATEGLYLSIRTARNQPLILDAAHVTYVGALFAQLLCVVEASWQTAGLAFEIRNPSESFLEALALLGLTPSGLMAELST